MRKIIVYFAISTIFISCKKEIQEVVVVTPVPAPNELKIEQVINDSTVVLKWSEFTGKFQKYRLVRSATYLKNGQFGYFNEAIDSSNDAKHLTFTERGMPLANDLYYDLYVSSDTTQFNQGF